jgi:hypothetical protein
MALADITPKLNIDIDLTQNTPRFTFQDATDYTAESVTIGDVQGNIKLIVNGATTPTYDNIDDWASPDIDGSDSGQTNEDLTRFRTQASYISAPLDSNDELVSGLYAFTYQVSDDSGVTTVVTTVTYDIQYDKVTGDIDYTINLNPLSPSLKIEDTTSYAVDSVTPTNNRALTLYYPPNSALGGSTTTTSASLTVTSFNVGIQSAKLVNNVSYDFSSKISTSAAATIPSVLSRVVNELVSSISTNSSDATNGTYSSISITTVGSPSISAVADVVVSSNAVTAITVLSSTGSYQVGDVLEINSAGIGGTTDVKITLTASDIVNLTSTPTVTLDILDEITAVENKIEVESVTSICDLYCCVKDFLTRLRQGTSTQKNALRQLAGEVSIYLEMISDAYACGKGEDINTYVAAIKDLVGCNDDCGCTGSTTPTVIQAISVGGMPVNNKFVYTGLASITTYTEPLLIGLTYETSGNPRRCDFSVFVGSAGQFENLSAFDPATGKMTFSGTVTTTFSIIRYR